jgi:CheY-like chemotaxis protein
MDETRKKKIVVADDDEDILSALKETLGEIYSVYAAQDGAEAVKLVKKIHPDLVIMDILMPEMDGLEACRRIKTDKQTAPIPVIFLTVKNQVEDSEKGFQSGADSYMSKPFSPEKLLQKVSQMIEISEIRKGLA